MIDQRGPGSTPQEPVVRLGSTGILPVKAFLPQSPEAAASMVSGEVGLLPVVGNGTARIPIAAAVALHGWWWGAVVAVCAVPFVWGPLSVAREQRDDDDERVGHDDAGLLALG